MPNNCLSVLYKHIIQVENKNVGLKVGGAQTYHCPPNQKRGGAHAPLAPPPPPPPPPRFLRQCLYTVLVIYFVKYNQVRSMI